jgi:hypothetical protein
MDPTHADIQRALLARRAALVKELDFVNGYLASLGIDSAPKSLTTLPEHDVDKLCEGLLQGSVATGGMTPNEVTATLLGSYKTPKEAAKRIVLASLERLAGRAVAYRGPGNKWRVRLGARKAFATDTLHRSTNGRAVAH